MGKQKKVFVVGETVEVQRLVGGPWVSCTYRGSVSNGERTRLHRVKGPQLRRYADPLTGDDVADPDQNPRAVMTDVAVVPSVRIRGPGSSSRE